MRKTTLKKYDLETINIIEDKNRGSQRFSIFKDCKLAQELAGNKKRRLEKSDLKNTTISELINNLSSN